jgi:hypothetical protein
LIEKVIDDIEVRIASLSMSCCQTPEQSAIRDALIEENKIFLDILERWFPSAFLIEHSKDGL